jgi:hypothetical protein
MDPGSFDATVIAAGPSYSSPLGSGLTEMSDTEEEMYVTDILDRQEAQMIEDPYPDIWRSGDTMQTPEMTFNAWRDTDMQETPDSEDSKSKGRQVTRDEVRVLIYFNLGYAVMLHRKLSESARSCKLNDHRQKLIAVFNKKIPSFEVEGPKDVNCIFGN